MNFKDERDNAAWSSFPKSQPSDPKDLELSMHSRGFKAGADWALKSSVVKELADAITELGFEVDVFMSQYPNEVGNESLRTERAEKALAAYQQAIAGEGDT